MFELEEYSNGYRDAFLNKYADSLGPTLDFYISDSIQDMLDIDIRSEVANVVGSSVNDYGTCLSDLPSSIDHTTDTLPTSNGSGGSKDSHVSSSWYTSSVFGMGSSNSSSAWFGANNDFLADVGACVNPISVMPLISSSLIHRSPKINLNANILRSNSPTPASPNVNDTKSHLTFSPAHIKLCSSSIRGEQLTSHIPKQVLPISSAVTSATTAPATLATNSALQRKNSTVDAIRKDLGSDLRKVIPISAPNENIIFKTNTITPTTAGSCSSSNSIISSSSNQGATTNSNTKIITTFANTNTSVRHHNGSIITSSNGNGNGNGNGNVNNNNHKNTSSNNVLFNAGSTSSSTIKLGPGIGGLTFANNITYNKLKQQSSNKSPTTGATATLTANGTVVLKRDRESSPLQNVTTLTTTSTSSSSSNGQHVTKILSRNSVQSSSSFTPKSIASSAHHTSYTLQQQNINGTTSHMNSSSKTNGNQSNSSAAPITTTINGSIGVFSASGLSSHSSSSTGSTSANIIAVKPLQQKIKAPPVESEFPKPAYSYSCLIAMALKNSRRGSLPVSEIYSFMCEHFPYFKTAPSGWKNSVRHNLSLNKCFEKIEKPPTNGNQRKGCLWAMNPERIAKMDEEVQKWSRKDPMAIRNAMVFPEHLEALERGEMKHGSSGDSDTEMDSQSEIEETSDMEEQELDNMIVDNMLVEEEEDIDDDTTIHASASSHQTDNDDDDGCEVPMHRRTHLRTTNSATPPLTIGTMNSATSNHSAPCITSNMQRDFDIEVEDIYDSIDIDDDKEAVRMAISQSDIIELSPADYNISRENHQSPKRARLNVSNSMGPASEIDKHFQIQKQQLQQVQIQGIKKIVKVQNVHNLQQLQQQLQQQQMQQQHMQQQHMQQQQMQQQQMQQQQMQQQQLQQQQLQQQQIVVQTMTTNSGNGQQQSNAQFTQIGTVSSLNDNQYRRKMQLVNRIS